MRRVADPARPCPRGPSRRLRPHPCPPGPSRAVSGYGRHIPGIIPCQRTAPYRDASPSPCVAPRAPEGDPARQSRARDASVPPGRGRPYEPTRRCRRPTRRAACPCTGDTSREPSPGNERPPTGMRRPLPAPRRATRPGNPGAAMRPCLPGGVAPTMRRDIGGGDPTRGPWAASPILPSVYGRHIPETTRCKRTAPYRDASPSARAPEGGGNWRPAERVIW